MSGVVAEQLKKHYEWTKVKAPKNWLPKNMDEELVGYYAGRTLKSGNFGQYEVILVQVPMRGTFMLSGTKIIQLIDAAMLTAGQPIRIVWKGVQDLGFGKRMKDYEVYVGHPDLEEPGKS